MRTIQPVSFLDSLRFTLYHALPNYLQGLFRKRPFWVGVVNACHSDPLGIRFTSRCRQRYQSRLLSISIFGRRTILVLDSETAEHVLRRSPTVYADPRTKRQGMSHFMPGAVTISRGEEWQDRRRFVDAILQNGRVHSLADSFLQVVREEVHQSLTQHSQQWNWSVWQTLFNHISFRVIFGDAARNDDVLLDDFERLMSQANRLFLLRRGRSFDRMYARIQHYITLADPRSLVGLFPQVSHQLNTLAARQIPHWMFAMKDTLALNTAAAFSLILNRPSVVESIHSQFPGHHQPTAADISHLNYLGGCIREAMRLWPTTPMLLRETIAADLLGNESIPPGTQVLIWNAPNHRDTAAVPDAHAFRPERWLTNSVDYQFNHLSNGLQFCAGADLAIFLSTAILSELLRQRSWSLTSPVFPPVDPVPVSFNPFHVKWTVISSRV